MLIHYVMLWPWPLTPWPWKSVVHRVSHGHCLLYFFQPKLDQPQCKKHGASETALMESYWKFREFTLLSHQCDVDLWPVTLNFCSTWSVNYLNTVWNISQIKDSASELLMQFLSSRADFETLLLRGVDNTAPHFARQSFIIDTSDALPEKRYVALFPNECSSKTSHVKDRGQLSHFWTLHKNYIEVGRMLSGRIELTLWPNLNYALIGGCCVVRSLEHYRSGKN